MSIKVLVTGARGLLGSAVAEHYRTDCEIQAFDHQQLDITNEAAVMASIQECKPTLIINCAAAARVDACESEFEKAWAVNAVAPGVLARAADMVGADIIHISTDYVFNGEKCEPYTIKDEPNPCSAYGRSKLAGERAVITATTRHYVVRVARLFGLHGNNFGSRIFDNLQQAADTDKKIKVFNYPLSQATYLPDLITRLREIATHSIYGLYQVTNSGPIVSWYEFARYAVELMGISKELIETAEYMEFALPAARPYYSGLRCLTSEQLGFVPMRDWRDALVEMYRHWCTIRNAQKI
ncbi:MAG: dTDP-4-dehydrorhamnose reductase [Acidobacteriota bacterium]